MNDKYYIDSDNNVRVYSLVKKGSLKIAVFLNGSNKTEAYMSQKNENEFWYKHEYGSILRTFKTIKKNNVEREINISGNDVKDFNYSNPDVTLYTKNGKMGIKYQGKKILKTECDSLEIYGEMAGIYTAKKIALYNANGSLLADDLKSFYKYSMTNFQIIDSESKMYLIDILGVKRKPSLYGRSVMGNDTDAKRTVTYEIVKGTVHKSVYEPKPYHKRNSDDEEDSDYHNYGDNYEGKMELPKNTIAELFVDNSQKIEAEDYWYYVAYYKPLPPNYVILKSREKFGVWDIEEKKSVLPFKYDKIVPKNSHLYLEKNGLITCYPYIGQKPKYKTLEDFTEYFARFEYPDGRKGWVDRKGVEFFD